MMLMKIRVQYVELLNGRAIMRIVCKTMNQVERERRRRKFQKVVELFSLETKS